MSSKKNKFPAASLDQIMWVMSYFNSLKSFKAAILTPDQYEVIEPFLRPQLKENPDFINQFGRVNLLTLHLCGDDYRKIIAEHAPDVPKVANGRVYVWITFIEDNMFVVMFNKVIYTRIKRNRKAELISDAKVDDTPINIESLRKKLLKALDSESYEVAAELRDKINGLNEEAE